MERSKHVIIIRLSALGDVAIAAPLVRAYALENPSVKFTMVSQKLMAPLFTGIENLHFIPLNLKQEGDIKGLMKFSRELLKLKPTHVADIHNVLRSRVIRWYLFSHGVKTRVINKNRLGRAKLTRKNNKDLTPLTSSQRNYENVLVSLGFKDLNFANTLPDKIKRSIGEGDSVNIGIAPFAKHKGKCWPTEYMEEVVAELSEDPKNKIFLFGGGKEEEKIFMGWEQKYPNTISTIGKQSFAEELELIKTLNVMVSMDSANMHFASYVGTPVVSVWGATHPSAGFYGWGQDLANAVQVDLACRPCSIFGNKECIRGDYACMKEVKPEMVLERIKKVIGF